MEHPASLSETTVAARRLSAAVQRVIAGNGPAVEAAEESEVRAALAAAGGTRKRARVVDEAPSIR